MLICVLTVLGLVRFLASVSQLLRWLYVLLLHDSNIWRVRTVRYNIGTPLRRDDKRTLQLPHCEKHTNM